MNIIHRLRKFALLMLFTSIPVLAALFDYDREDYRYFANTSLSGIKSVALNIDTPVGVYYSNLERYGVSSTVLEQNITNRLRNVGINVISFNEALEDPAAALLDLRVRMTFPEYSFYSYNLLLSVKQKVPLPQGNNTFYSVRTWSDGKIGAVEQSRLTILNDYTMQLVDNFIAAYQAQN
jgi:hypothetical protein